jgi:aspartate/methionine/tyrosine aminotransferase
MPTDGLVAFPPLPMPVPARVFADRLRERFGVAVTPGSFFGFDRHLRVGLGLAPALFEEALARLGRAIDAGIGA